MTARTIVVVGASLAGLRAAETLRSSGFDGRLVLVGAESHLPYDRPPLSKALLAGEWEPDRIHLRRTEQLGQLDLEMHLGVPATALDPAGRVVNLADGRSFAFDGCIIATGSAPRRLPGQPVGWAGLHELRTLDDSLALRHDLTAHGERRVVVIGAGFIGAEVAATASKLGHRVTVLEALPAPLVRGLGEEMGWAVGGFHRQHGVDLRCGVGVAGFVGDGRVEGVTLSDGETVAADVVVVGIGVAPCTGWLASSGLRLDNGVVCDAFLGAAPRVYAAGDVARWPWADGGELTRIEHWTNASEQGGVAAANLLAELDGGERRPYVTVPFVWSDQYDRRIQVVGRIAGDDDVHVAHGSVAEGSWVALYGRGDRLRGVLAINQPRKLMSYRKLLLDGGATWAEALAHAAGLEAP